MEPNTQTPNPAPIESVPVTPPGTNAPGQTESLPTPAAPPPSTEEANKMREEKPKGNKTILIIVLIAVVLVVVAGAGFLFFTEQGKALIGLAPAETETMDQELPINDSSDSMFNEDDSNPVIEPDFSDSSEEEALDETLTDLDEILESGDGSDDFDEYDESSEFGI